ncbi:hypothetical protein V6N13_089233 [Hibiscus sabdariffa]
MEPFPLFGLQSSHLNICYYHQDLHRRPLRPGSRPGFYGDRRALLLIGGLALAPTAGTPWSVFQDGPDGEPAGRRPEHAGAEARRDGALLGSTIEATTSPRAYQRPGLGAATTIRVGPRPEPIGGPALAVPHPDRGASPAPHPLPSRQFQALFDSLFKVLFIFPSRQRLVVRQGPGTTGALTLSGAPFQGTWARSVAEDASPDYNSDAEGDRFSSWAIPGSLAVTKGILAGFDNDPSAGSPTETLLRLLLPLNDKVQWTSRDVAGSEPPTSPRSEHFTGPFNRAGGTTRPIKARSASPAVGTSRPVLTVRRTGRPTPRSNYELFNCNNLNIRYWSWNYRGCWHQTCPPMDPR